MINFRRVTIFTLKSLILKKNYKIKYIGSSFFFHLFICFSLCKFYKLRKKVKRNIILRSYRSVQRVEEVKEWKSFPEIVCAILGQGTVAPAIT